MQVANIYENYDRPYAYVYQINKDAYEDKNDAENGYFLLLTEKENEKMSAWLATKKNTGAIIDDFAIDTPGYDLRGHVGETFFVYIFENNVFYTKSDGKISPR